MGSAYSGSHIPAAQDLMRVLQVIVGQAIEPYLRPAHGCPSCHCAPMLKPGDGSGISLGQCQRFLSIPVVRVKSIVGGY